MSSPSRYAAVGTAAWVAPDGTTVPYLLRRFLPQAGQLATQGTYLVRPGDRVDVIANATLGDPELSWLLADANLVNRPCDLNKPDTTIIIPFPAGVPSGQ
ncbi:MAG: LysM domain-containing protein [Streptosporangiaceae bacterium]